MKIIECFLTKNPCYIANRKITVKGLMLHSVGCSQPSANVFIEDWNRADYNRACVHAFIDGNTGDTFQTLPWNHRGKHGGGVSNNTHIGVEMCEPASIKYATGGKFTVLNKEDAASIAKRTYNSAVELFAVLCKKYNLNPLEDGVIISHKEGYKRGIASNHGDPEHLWNQLELAYTMDTFRSDVNNAIKTGKEDDIMYYVQVPFKNNADAETVKNAFKVMGVNCTINTGENAVPEQKPTITNAVVEGDQVSVIQGATWYLSSAKVPNWVIDKQWIVKSCSGDRAVIDKSVDGVSSICSPIHTKYLVKV